MRHSLILVLGLAVALCGTLLGAVKRPQQPSFLLQETQDRRTGIDPVADWRSQRTISGIGWELMTVSRGEGSVMDGGLTVIHLSKVAQLSSKRDANPSVPLTFKHCYVLAAFDLVLQGYLLVTVRDPQYYWKDYDYKEGVVDPVELVWYDQDWQEEQSLTLDYATEDFPDDFVLSPDKRTLLAIKHPVNSSGDPAKAGQSLNMIYLASGNIDDVYLPEADERGNLPAGWGPVQMAWDSRGYLVVQAGNTQRRYSMKWE